MDLRDFGQLWGNKPICKANREDFINDYYELLGRTDKKQSCSAILNELSRFFLIKRTRANVQDVRDNGCLLAGENYYIIEGVKLSD